MSLTFTLEAVDRASLGTANSRRLRRDGLIPAVIYGKKLENLNVAFGREQFETAIRQHTRILDVKLPGGKVEKAILKEVQWDTFGDEVLHVDLGRVALDDRIQLSIALRFAGDPKGVAAGGHLEVYLHEARIECLAGSIPESLKIEVSHLELDQVMRVRDVTVPEGVRLLEDAETAVASVKKALEEFAPAAAPAEAGAAEPEVIAKGKKEEEGAEEEK